MAKGARLWAELAILAVIGLLMGVLGPFGSDAIPTFRKFAHWQICMVGGGVIGMAIDRLLMTRMPRSSRRVPIVVIAMTLPVTLLVTVENHVMLGEPLPGLPDPMLLWQVFVVSLAVMTVRALAWRQPKTIVETRTLVAAPLPQAEATFRARLSAKRRSARLIAIEADDHYLRVHTDAGEELITARFADALTELALAHGHRVHRSWWIAADAIEDVRWRRGNGDARLTGGLTVPVSRSYAPAMKEAGWR